MTNILNITFVSRSKHSPPRL